MWKSLLLILPILMPATGYTLEYLIDEELPPYTSVADLLADCLTQTTLRFDSSQLKFRIIKKAKHEPVHFIIHEEAGLLYTAISFNREKLCPDQLACQLTIDIGIMSRFRIQEYERFQVNVHIKDINDNSPRFPMTSLDITISESSPEGSIFSLLEATDQDSGDNGNLKYKLIPSDGPFRLQKDYLPRIYLAIKKKLVHDLKNVFALSLYAEDGGNPTRNSSLLLSIIVTAVDKSTIATTRMQSTQTTSSTSTTTTLPAVLDTSGSTSTQNPTPTSAKMSQSTGTTKLSSILTIISTALPRTTEKLKHTSIMDPIAPTTKIPHPPEDPVTTKSAKTTTTANTPQSTSRRTNPAEAKSTLLKITTTIASTYTSQATSFTTTTKTPKPTHVSMTTTESSRTSLFQSSLPTTAKTLMTSIATQTPIIQEKSTSTERISPAVTDNLSKKSTISTSKPSMISSSNSASPRESSTSSSTTSRLDVSTLASSNDANVTFGPEGEINEIDFEFHVPENLPSGSNVGVVKLVYGTDNFPASNYTLYTAQEKPDSFFIDPSGLLTTSRLLDRERISEYYLIVYDATRNFITSNASVVVKVVVDDVNDHKPIFTFPTILNSTSLVQFNSTPNQFVAKLNSIDEDTGMNGKVSFRIDYGNENGLFKIDSDTGEVSVARYMTSGDKLNYQLMLSAADHGDIPLMTWSMLKVNFTQVTVGRAMAENGMLITSIILPVTIVITIIIVVIIGRVSCFRGNCCSKVPKKDYDKNVFMDFSLHVQDTMPKIRSDSINGKNSDLVW